MYGYASMLFFTGGFFIQSLVTGSAQWIWSKLKEYFFYTTLDNEFLIITINKRDVKSHPYVRAGAYTFLLLHDILYF